MTALEPLGDNVFVVDGPRVRDMGVWFETRMTVVRLAEGSMWIASPVETSYATLTEITRLGPVRYLVSPTPRHHWRLDRWHRLFPEAELWSSPITPVTLKGGDVPLTGILGERVPPAWAGDLEHVLVRGSTWLQEVLFFHPPSRTVLVEDLIQIHSLHHGQPVRNALITLGGVAAPRGGVPRDIRLSFRDRSAARESVDQVLQWDFDTLVVAHGPVVTQHARRTFERAFSWLRE
jgi:Domain of unknown function (DUF4336)